MDLHRVAIQDVHAGVGQHPCDESVERRFEVVVAEHGDDRHARDAKLLGKQTDLVFGSHVGQVATEHEHVGFVAQPGERLRDETGRAPSVVEIAERRDPNLRFHPQTPPFLAYQLPYQ